MTAQSTLPISGRTALTHEHAWLVESRHPTSEGVVLYVRCTGCTARRVDVQRHPLAPPDALSRALRQ